MLDFRTETFLTVCQTMNFTAAVRKLNITQPAVSQHIRFLEEQYHTSLFRYQNKQLFLTRSGEILHKHLLTMKNDEKAVIAELKSSSTGIKFLLFMCCNRFSCPEVKCPEKGFCFLPFALISGRQMHRINACIFLVAIT